jgi:hypothetical protein
MRAALLILLGALATDSRAETAVYTSSTVLAAASHWHVGATWAVIVFSPKHLPIGSMVIRLTDAKADSCMGGDWKRVEVVRYQSRDSRFIAKRPLSYLIQGKEFIVGANEICDGYVWLHGTLLDGEATGGYGDLSISGSNDLGSFFAVLVSDGNGN